MQETGLIEGIIIFKKLYSSATHIRTDILKKKNLYKCQEKKKRKRILVVPKYSSCFFCQEAQDSKLKLKI